MDELGRVNMTGRKYAARGVSLLHAVDVLSCLNVLSYVFDTCAEASQKVT
jgi:hypothetical protein